MYSLNLHPMVFFIEEYGMSNDALISTGEFTILQQNLCCPERTMLPKGREHGKPYQFLFFIDRFEYKKDNQTEEDFLKNILRDEGRFILTWF